MLRTHSHADHVEHEEEIDLPVVNSSFEIDGLQIEAIPTPGHSDDMVCFVIRDEWGEEYVFSGDTLFKNSIGGGNFEQIKSAVMDVYMEMPKTRLVMPGHTDLTTIQAECANNPFVRVWRGEDPEGTEAVTVGGRDATLIVWSDDYDGKGKALGALRRRRGRHRRRLDGRARRRPPRTESARRQLSRKRPSSEKDSRLARRCA